MSDETTNDATDRPAAGRIDPRVLAGGAPVIGLGIGMVFGQPGIGAVLGAGVGIVLRAVAKGGQVSARDRDRGRG